MFYYVLESIFSPSSQSFNGQQSEIPRFAFISLDLESYNVNKRTFLYISEGQIIMNSVNEFLWLLSALLKQFLLGSYSSHIVYP